MGDLMNHECYLTRVGGSYKGRRLQSTVLFRAGLPREGIPSAMIQRWDASRADDGIGSVPA